MLEHPLVTQEIQSQSEVEFPVPLNLPALPSIYRVTSLAAKMLSDRLFRCSATLFHERASMKVCWYCRQPDVRIRPGMLVSPRWLIRQDCDIGALKISRLVLLETPVAMENLFDLVPHGWVKDRTLIRQAAALIEILPRSHRHLFNAVFWNGDRFRRYCNGPSSLAGHHDGESGNFKHSIEVATLMSQHLGQRHPNQVAIGILSGLLHDAGKADEYVLDINGKWVLTDRGRLLGHRVTVIEWIAAAMSRYRISLPSTHYMALLHCLTSSQNAPDWLGIRRPAMLAAMLLSDMDRLSGVGELMHRCSQNLGWGKYHPHLRNIPYSVEN